MATPPKKRPRKALLWFAWACLLITLGSAYIVLELMPAPPDASTIIMTLPEIQEEAPNAQPPTPKGIEKEPIQTEKPHSIERLGDSSAEENTTSLPSAAVAFPPLMSQTLTDSKGSSLWPQENEETIPGENQKQSAQAQSLDRANAAVMSLETSSKEKNKTKPSS